MIKAASVLAGQFKAGRQTTYVNHAVSDVPISLGRFKRDSGEAFCNKKYNTSTNLSDEYGWTDGTDIDCPKCTQIVSEIGQKL